MFRKRFASLLFALISFVPLLTNAQKENHIWYAPYVSLDFNATPAPGFLNSPNIPSNGQPASICDSSGALLFYTNGNIVYGKDHLPMPDGILANGAASRFDLHPCSALILPKSGTQYYLFSLLPDSISVAIPDSVATQYMIHPSLYFSIIDMQLNSGNGDIVPGNKKILLRREVMRGFLAGCKGPGCDSAWIVAHDRQAPDFLAYPVTAAGVGNPVSSSSGVNFLADNMPGYGFHYGKFSPDTRTLGLFSWRRSIAMPVDPGSFASLELITFNAQSGIFSNAKSLYENLDFSPYMYGFYPMSFSSDSKKFYTVQRTDYDVANWNKVVQYDLSSPVLAGILASEQVIGEVPPASPSGSSFMNDMRLAGDDKIYIASGDIFPLSLGTAAVPLARIPNPNAAAATLETGLSSPLMIWGNPVLFPAANILFEGTVTTKVSTERLCWDGSLVLGASQSGHYTWNTGSQDSSITITQPGTYWVRTGNDCTQHIDTFIVVPPLNPDLLPDDTTVCQGSRWTITLPAHTGIQYMWQDGSTGNSYEVSRDGLIVVTAHSNCGALQDSMRVTYGNCNCDLLFIPTAFSPNADGINDIFLPRYPCAAGIRNYELKVYNRWGQLAFYSGMPEQGWDGLTNGHLSDLGVYHYTVKIRAEGRKEELFRSGQVTLLR